jgi:hypothetical protein
MFGPPRSQLSPRTHALVDVKGISAALNSVADFGSQKTCTGPDNNTFVQFDRLREARHEGEKIRTDELTSKLWLDILWGSLEKTQGVDWLSTNWTISLEK